LDFNLIQGFKRNLSSLISIFPTLFLLIAAQKKDFRWQSQSAHSEMTLQKAA
jgi:hypothetical protein